MKYYQKLNLTFNLSKTQTRILDTHGYQQGSDKPRFTRKYVTKKDIEYIKKQLPDKLIKHITGINICDLNTIEIHSHTREQSIINYYLSVDDEITVFYEPIDKNTNIYQIDNSEWKDNNTSYRQVIDNQVKEVARFQAKLSECWLLDVVVPHSVEATKEIEKTRSILQIYLNTSFNDSLNILNDLLDENI